MKPYQRKIMIWLSVALLLVVLYIALPSRITSEREVKFYYDYFPSIRLLEHQQVSFPERGTLRLIKRHEGDFVMGTPSPQQIAIVLTCKLDPRRHEEDGDTTQRSHTVRLSCVAMTSPLSKWRLWMQYSDLKQKMETYMDGIARLGMDAKVTYGLDARLERCEDSVAYTQYMDWGETKLPSYEVVEQAFRQTVKIADEGQVFPGSFAVYAKPEKLMYAWICRANGIAFAGYTAKKIVAGGSLYASEKLRIPIDSLVYYQQQASQLATDRGFVVVAVPFTKVYAMMPESKSIVARIFVPVD